VQRLVVPAGVRAIRSRVPQRTAKGASAQAALTPSS
jgi:osmoprotectant transport system permease protein